MDSNYYIPQTKDDFSSIERLKKLNDEKIDLLLPELLEWLQDSNWPIYNAVKLILISQQKKIVEPLRQVLRSNDSSWKYFILSDFLPCLDDSVLKYLKTELFELAYEPLSIEDKLEEIDICALNLLKIRFK